MLYGNKWNGHTWNNGNTWNTGDKKELAKDCSFCTKHPKQFVLTPELYSVVIKLCQEIEVEWQMLLGGKWEGDKLLLNTYYIPKQEVSGASVKNLDCIDQEFVDKNKIVATIHSHAGMGVFFSPTDEEFTNQSIIANHIVVNNKLDFKAVSVATLPCGMATNHDATVHVSYPEVAVKGMENIQEVVPNVQTWYPPKNKIIGFNKTVKDDKPSYISNKQWKKWKKNQGGVILTPAEEAEYIARLEG